MPYDENRPTVRVLVLCKICNNHLEKLSLKGRYNCKHVFDTKGGSFAFVETGVEDSVDDFVELVMDEDAQGNEVEFVLVDRPSCLGNPKCANHDMNSSPGDNHYQLEALFLQYGVATKLEEHSEECALLAEDGLFFIDDQLDEIYVPVLGNGT